MCALSEGHSMLVSSGSFKIFTKRFCKIDMPVWDVNNDQKNGWKLQNINIHEKSRDTCWREVQQTAMLSFVSSEAALEYQSICVVNRAMSQGYFLDLQHISDDRADAQGNKYLLLTRAINKPIKILNILVLLYNLPGFGPLTVEKCKMVFKYSKKNQQNRPPARQTRLWGTTGGRT